MARDAIAQAAQENQEVWEDLVKSSGEAAS